MTTAEIGTQPEQLYKRTRRGIADLKIKLVFLFLNWVQKASWGG